MTIDRYEKGKKYWRQSTRTVRSRTKVTTDAIFVVEIDKTNNRISASVNGLPATWFNEEKFSRWKKDKPV